MSIGYFIGAIMTKQRLIAVALFLVLACVGLFASLVTTDSQLQKWFNDNRMLVFLIIIFINLLYTNAFFLFP